MHMFNIPHIDISNSQPYFKYHFRLLPLKDHRQKCLLENTGESKAKKVAQMPIFKVTTAQHS